MASTWSEWIKKIISFLTPLLARVMKSKLFYGAILCRTLIWFLLIIDPQLKMFTSFPVMAFIGITVDIGLVFDCQGPHFLVASGVFLILGGSVSGILQTISSWHDYDTCTRFSEQETSAGIQCFKVFFFF